MVDAAEHACTGADAASEPEPLIGDVADTPPLSEYLPPLPVSNPDTAGQAEEQMTGNDGTAQDIAPEPLQQQEPEEEGPPPTVDELLVEYGSSRPSSPSSVPASPASDVSETAPGNETITTTENGRNDGSDAEPPVQEQPPQPQLNGEDHKPAAENGHSDSSQTESEGSGGVDAETPAEQMDRPAAQHIDVDSLLNSSFAPLPQAQEEPVEAVESEMNGVASDGNATCSVPEGTSTTETSESAGNDIDNEGDENKDPALDEQASVEEGKSTDCKDGKPVEFTLTFVDYVDMQSRLVLVPIDDGECLGAKIASFSVPNQEHRQQTEAGSNTNNNSDSNGDGNDQADVSDVMDDIDLDAGSSEEKKGDDADEADLQSGANDNDSPNAPMSYSSPPIKPEDVVGSVLFKIPGLAGENGEEDDDDWAQVDFTYILSAMRDVEAPISLHFRRANENGTEIATSQSMSEPSQNEQGDATVSTAETDLAPEPAGLMSTRLSRWGSRASQLALEAKEKARIAMEEAERQLEKKGIAERIAGVTSSKVVAGGEGNGSSATEIEGDVEEELSPSPRTWEEAGLTHPPCGLYLQKASGSFAQLDANPDITDAPQMPQISESSLSNAVPLRPTLSSSSLASRASTAGLSWQKKLARLHPVSNTSVLLVRAAAESPCPAKGYEYQWYRSCKRNVDDTSRDSHTSSHSGANDGSSQESVDGWFALEGATYAAFQPSATDIGHRVRCVVTIHSMAGTADADNKGPVSDAPIQVICELPFPVVADPGLFSASRQGFAAPNGGVFANLKGRGNASGRNFRLQIMPSQEGSRIRVFQTSGSTAELLHDVQEPIVFASAIAMPAEPKVFDIYFPSGLPESAGMVRALCNDDGHFKLKAPNRVARESLLLSLGIANFCALGGKPVDLDASSTLFPDTPHGAVIEYDYSRQNSTKEEGNMTTPHAVREVKVVSPVREKRMENGGDPLPLPGLASSCDRPTAPEEKTRAWMTPSLLPLSPKTPSTVNTTEADARFQALEAELRSKIETIFAKEKTCTDLQRRAAAAEGGKRRSDDQVKSLKAESEMYKKKHADCSRALRSAERKIEMNDNAMARMKQEYEARIASLEDRVKQSADASSEQGKTITILTNEKAVLEAAVEARDGKLSAMGLLHDTVSDLRKQVADNESARKNLGRCKADLDEMTARLNDAHKELEKAEQLKAQLSESQESAKKEQKTAERCKAQMESANTRYQKIKVELRSAKQKVESLSKDLSRAHATARSARSASKDAEHAKKMKSIQRECEELKKEISHLTSEKRRIAEERDESRRLHEQSIKSQVEAGIDEKVVRALERYNELERVVSELTEYVSAKEMQLETIMEVNKALQDEIASLRK